jgi:transposase
MSVRRSGSKVKRGRRVFTEEFKQEAVQMLIDGHTAPSVSERLGIGVNLLYRWKSQVISASPAASSLEQRVRELESELLRTQRERDILKKALAIFGRSD